MNPPRTVIDEKPVGRQHRAVHHTGRGLGIKVDARKMRHHFFFARQHRSIERRAHRLGESADAVPPKPTNVGPASEQATEIIGKRANVSARRTRHRHAPHTGVAGWLDLETVDPHGPSLAFNFDTLARVFVQPLAVDLQGRNHRRHLLDVAQQVLVDHATSVVDGHTRHVEGLERFTRVVEGRRSRPQHNLAGVVLVGTGDPLHQPRRATDTDHQNTGGVGIQSSGMPDASFSQGLAQLADDIVAGHSGGLVDDHRAVHDRGPALCHQASSRVMRSRRSRSARRTSSMRSAARITSSGRNSRTGVFFARTCLPIDDWMRRR